MTQDVRMVRQGLVIPEGLKEATIVVVGLGMLGSWTSAVLARLADRVHGWDFDTVGEENLGTQLYNSTDVGISKAYATSKGLAGLPFTAHAERFDPNGASPQALSLGTPNQLVVVACVDSFAGRRTVAEWAARYADYYVDTRAHATVGVVKGMRATRENLDNGDEYASAQILQYLATLETDEGAPEPACGMEGCAFVGAWVAQEVAALLVRHYKGLQTGPYSVTRDVALGFDIGKVVAPIA